MKTHFHVCSEPLDTSLPLEALCGALISHPLCDLKWNMTVKGLPDWNPLRDCGECIRKVEAWGRDPVTGELITQTGIIYIYGLVEAKEAEAEP